MGCLQLTITSIIDSYFKIILLGSIEFEMNESSGSGRVYEASDLQMRDARQWQFTCNNDGSVLILPLIFWFLLKDIVEKCLIILCLFICM